jgi:hypothetical protein
LLVVNNRELLIDLLLHESSSYGDVLSAIQEIPEPCPRMLCLSFLIDTVGNHPDDFFRTAFNSTFIDNGFNLYSNRSISFAP